MIWAQCAGTRWSATNPEVGSPHIPDLIHASEVGVDAAMENSEFYDTTLKDVVLPSAEELEKMSPLSCATSANSSRRCDFTKTPRVKHTNKANNYWFNNHKTDIMLDAECTNEVANGINKGPITRNCKLKPWARRIRLARDATREHAYRSWFRCAR